MNADEGVKDKFYAKKIINIIVKIIKISFVKVIKGLVE